MCKCYRVVQGSFRHSGVECLGIRTMEMVLNGWFSQLLGIETDCKCQSKPQTNGSDMASGSAALCTSVQLKASQTSVVDTVMCWWFIAGLVLVTPG